MQASATVQASPAQSPVTQASATQASIAETSVLQAPAVVSTPTSGDCGSCGDCYQCCRCGPDGQFWLREEYLGWWAKGGHVPALVATSPNGTLPTTQTLYGDADYNGDYRSGTWTQGGMWLDCCHTHGIQGDYFYVGQQSSPFFASSDGDPILGRPFIDANTGNPSDQLIAFPGRVVGSISVSNTNWLSSGGIDWRRNLCCCNDGCQSGCECKTCFRGQNCRRIDFIAGFRYYGFNDNLGINEQLTSIDQTSGVPVGTQFNLSDSFRTQNNFYGGELGLIGERYSGRWMYEWTAKVALGDMQQLVSIDGHTIVSFPGQPTAVSQGGLLALSSNIGHYAQNEFAAIPQFSARIGYRATEQLTFLAGYTFIYYGQVARAGDQIDTTINPNLIPPPIGGGPNRPSFEFHTSSLWLQGITLGAEYSF